MALLVVPFTIRNVKRAFLLVQEFLQELSITLGNPLGVWKQQESVKLNVVQGLYSHSRYLLMKQ